MGPSRADPFRRRPRGWRCRKGRAFPERDGDGALDRARTVNSTAASRTSHFQLERWRAAESPLAWLSANAAQKTEGKFSCLQTPEISQNSEIFWRRRGHEEASRRKSAMTEGASPEVVPHGSLGQRGADMEGKFSCLQTLEISQNRKIIPRRSGRRDSLSRKPAMTSSQPGSR